MSKHESKLFHMAVMQAWNAIVITNADPATGYAVEMANPAFCQMTGYAFDELKGRSLNMLQGPETDQAVIDRLRDCLRDARYFEGTAVNYRKDGSTYVVRWNISPVRDEEGVLTHFVSVQQDMSDYVQSERKNRLLARALDASSDPILLTDVDARIIFVNQAFTDITGYPAEELIGKTPALLRSGQHDESFYADLRLNLSRRQAFRATFINRRRDGSIYYAEQSITPISDDKGQVSHYVSVSKDISEQVRREMSLREAATRDQLTGLHNRYYAEQRLDDAQQEARTTGRPLAVILCDVDHFKQVNDRFGHLVGDRVLQSVASTLRQNVRGTDAVTRWGGEEFLILLEDCTEQRAVELAERIRERLQANADADAGSVTLSFGIASLQPGESVAGLIGRADSALYAAKRSGRDRFSLAGESAPS